GLAQSMGHPTQRERPLPGHRSGVSRGFPDELNLRAHYTSLSSFLLTITAGKSSVPPTACGRAPKTIRAGNCSSHHQQSGVAEHVPLNSIRTPIYRMITVSFRL